MISLDTEALQRVSIGSPDWLGTARAEAFARYESLDMPSPKEEIWRYVDLGFSLDDYSMADEPGEGLATDVAETPGPRIALVDGLVTDEPEASADGVSLVPLAQALREEPDLESTYEGLGTVRHDKFTSASRAFGRDGARLRIGKGAIVTDPVFIDIQAATDRTVSFPRVVIAAEEGSQSSVVVRFRSSDPIDSLFVPEIDADVGVNSNLRLTVIQRLGRGTTSIARTRVVAHRDAQVTVAEAGLGGALARLHLSVDLEGRGSSARIVGAYFGDRDQVLDYRYFMRHVGENTTSDMFLKGGVEDEALSIFTGMIRIEESAQRTNAFQTNRNLLLSDNAVAQSVPNLEILANDVKCGHGSTVGPLDEEQRYYLMSRGLSRKRADRLQVRGFFEEALGKFPEASVTGPVRDRINAKFVAAQREGRV